EDVGETTLRQTTVQRHLAAFETNLSRITRARLLSLLTATRGLAQTRAWSTSDTLLLVGRTLGGLKAVQTDSHSQTPSTSHKKAHKTQIILSLLCLFVALFNYAQQVRHFRHGAAHRV